MESNGKEIIINLYMCIYAFNIFKDVCPPHKNKTMAPHLLTGIHSISEAQQFLPH